MEKETKKPESKEGKRKVGLINLKDDVIKALAVAYLVENGEGFGEIPKQAVHGKYLETLTSEQGSKFITSSVLGSSEGRGRYRGAVNEYDMLEKGMHIFQESILTLKVSDVLAFVGAKAKIKKQYADRYVNELSDDEKKAVIGVYQTNITTSYVADALKKIGDSHSKTLEEMFCDVPKKDNIIKFNPNAQREYKEAA